VVKPDPHDVERIFPWLAHTSPVTAICVCGAPVDGMRSDARYCSNACRQRAYRARRAVAP
jgi:hypothetical protein